jgi:hypothetical protein
VRKIGFLVGRNGGVGGGWVNPSKTAFAKLKHGHRDKNTFDLISTHQLFALEVSLSSDARIKFLDLSRGSRIT